MTLSRSTSPSPTGRPARTPSPPSGAEAEVTTRWPAWHVSAARHRRSEEVVAAELPLAIRLNGHDVATVVCTPCDLEDLVVGFLTAEGLLCPGDPLSRLEVDVEAGVAEVTAPGRTVEPGRVGAPVVGSCCGKSRLGFYFEADARTAAPVESDLTLDSARCVRLMQALQASNPVFEATGGVHTAALAGPEGLEAVRIDIGRHNTLDKLYGHALRHGWSLSERVVAFSGRISSEVVLKLAKMGAPVLLSKSAPTDLALRLAEELGVTTIGFLRGVSTNVYTRADRLSDLPRH